MPKRQTVTTARPSGATSRPIVSDPTVGYIAGDDRYAYWASDRALPQTIDEAERAFGIDIYHKMAQEPILQSVIRTLKTRVMADGIAVRSSHVGLADHVAKGRGTPEDAEVVRRSEEIAGYVETVLHRFGRGNLKQVVKNLLDAAHLGHKLAEVTYDHLPNGPYAGKLGIASIRCKPRRNYAFLLGPQNEFRGVLAKIPGVSAVVWQGMLVDPAGLPNAVAPDKLLILHLDTEDGNPQGVSWLRACYDTWRRKQLYRPEEVQVAMQFAGGKIAVVAPEDRGGVAYTDAETRERSDLKTLILKAAQRLGNGGVAVFPFGTDVQVIAPSANAEFFDAAFDRCDREMVLAFLLSARTVLEARHSSKADSDAAQDILDELVTAVRSDVCDLLTDLFRRLVRMSYGEEIAQLYCPTASMQKASRPNFAANATAVAALVRSGFLDASQYAMVDDEILGLEARETVGRRG